MKTIADAFPDWHGEKGALEQHMTECSTGSWSGDWKTRFMVDTKSLFIEGGQNMGQSVIRWNLALDNNSGPKCTNAISFLPGSCCDTCYGVLKLEPGEPKELSGSIKEKGWEEKSTNPNFEYRSDFYTIAHH